MTVDVFCKSYKKDFAWLKYTLQSIHKYATGYRDIIIAIPRGEAQYLEGITTEKVVEVDRWDDDYLFQQHCKLTAYNYTDADMIAMWDSDLLVKEPINIPDYFGVFYKTRYEKVGSANCWKEVVDKALKIDDNWERMRRHFFTYHRETLKSFGLYMQLLHGKTLEEYIKEQPFGKFSEFNVLNAYCELFEGDKYKFIDTDSVSLPPEKLRQFWSHSTVQKNIGEINSILYPDFKKELLGLPQDTVITDDIKSGLNITYNLTMLGYDRLQNIEEMLERVNDVEGEIVETGVWRGGACILMKQTLLRQKSEKKLYVCDSFEGLPKPDAKYPADDGDRHYAVPMLSVSEEEVKSNFEKYGLLDENVIFVKGWFKDTLHKIPAEKLSLIRLDGDLYQSTWEALEALYPKLSSGGVCLVDDFALKGCKEAVLDYRKKYNITELMLAIDWTGIYWVKK